MGKAGRGPKNTNSTVQLKGKPEIWCYKSEKQKKYKQKPQQNQTSICKYCGSSHPPQRCPVYGKRGMKCDKVNHLWAVYRSMTHTAVHKVEQEQDKYTEEAGKIDMVNINIINSNVKSPGITANLKDYQLLKQCKHFV